MQYRIVALLIVLSTFAAISGCSTHTRVVELAPVKLVTHRTPKPHQPKSEIIDVIEEYNKGVAAYKQRQLSKSEYHFRRVMKHFPNTKWGKQSTYNLAIVLKEEKKYQEAAELFEKYLNCCTKTVQDKIDSYLFLMECYEGASMWQKVLEYAAKLHKLSKTSKLTNDELLEMYVRKGRALIETGQLDKADIVLQRATNLYMRSKGHGEYLDPNLGAEAYFLRGMVEAKRFDMTEIDESSEQRAMETLNEKAQHLLNAQERFLLCINEGQPEWAAAAGFETGRMYEDFYMYIVTRKIPEFAQKDEESKTIYLCMLKEFIFGMLRKAITIYSEVVKLGERTERNSPWIEKTRSRLTKLEEFYAKELRVCEPYRPAYMKPLEKYLKAFKNRAKRK